MILSPDQDFSPYSQKLKTYNHGTRLNSGGASGKVVFNPQAAYSSMSNKQTMPHTYSPSKSASNTNFKSLMFSTHELK
jgi:hypothetical protein